MNLERNDMDNLLRDKFLSYEGDVSASDWSAIEKKLDNKRRFAWLWWAALPLIIISGLWLYSALTSPSTNKNTSDIIPENRTEKDKSSSEKAKIEIKKDKTADNTVTEPEKEAGTSESGSSVTGDKKPLSKMIAKSEIGETKTDNDITDIESISLTVKSLKDIWTFRLPDPQLLNNPERINATPKKPRFVSFEFGFNLAPALGLDAIKKNSSRSNFINRDYFSSIKGSSSFGSGFNNGIHAQMNLGKHWYLRQGIYTSDYSVSHDYNHTISFFPNVDSERGIMGYLPIAPETVKYSGKSTLKYISLPIMIGNRTFFTKNIGLETKTGLTLSRLLSASGNTIDPTYLTLEAINSKNTIKKWTTGITISTGLFYKMNNNLIFTLEPNYSTLLGSAQSKNYAVKNRYYNYGINLNVNYILKRK